MAKKNVATLRTGKGKEFAKVIRPIKTSKGTYSFKEAVVHIDHIQDFLKEKESDKK